MSTTTVTKEWSETVCKIGQGAACCSYLGMGADGLECFKHLDGLRELLDERRELGTITAMGDNCEGKFPEDEPTI